MNRKTKGIIGVTGGLVLIGIPILYNHFQIPQDTTNTIIAFVVGYVSSMSVNKVSKVRAEKKALQKEQVK